MICSEFGNRSELLEALYPRRVVGILSQEPDSATPLLPCELKLTAKMAEKRIRQFRHGRACARRALNVLGKRDTEIPVGAGGAPVWPTGTSGSISHTGKLAGAVVARSSEFESLGLDIECATPLESDLVSRICTKDELTSVPVQFSVEMWAKLVFSLKEAVYKCVWPRVLRVIDFVEVSVEIEPSQHTFTASCAAGNGAIAGVDDVAGTFKVAQDHIFASAWLDAHAEGANTVAIDREPGK